MDFTLDLFDDFEDKEFMEIAEAIDEVCYMKYESFYLEAVNDSTVAFHQKVGNTVKNTAKTTKDVVSAYGKVTDAKAKSYTSLWGFFVRCLNLVVKMVTFVVSRTAEIPEKLNKLFDNITNIPSDIMNKLHGNIKLYITASDFEVIYKHSILKYVREFTKAVESLAKGDVWTTFFKGRGVAGAVKGIFKGEFSSNDKKVLHQSLEPAYNKIEKLELTESTIDMSNPDNIKLYFGNVPKIEIPGTQPLSYVNALKKMNLDIKENVKVLDEVKDDFSKKLADTEASQDFGKLSKSFQEDLNSVTDKVAKVSAMLANLTKCAVSDINTISKAAASARKKYIELQKKNKK